MHTTLQASPAQLAFGRDMIVHTKFVADWARIREHQHALQIRDNLRENLVAFLIIIALEIASSFVATMKLVLKCAVLRMALILIFKSLDPLMEQ